VLFAAAATAAALFALVSVNVLVGQSGIHRDSLSRRVHAKQLRLERLQVDVANASSPQLLAARATALGLVAGTEAVFLPRPSPLPVVAAGRGSKPAAKRVPRPTSSPGRGGR
jgi:hypothetical protein